MMQRNRLEFSTVWLLAGVLFHLGQVAQGADESRNDRRFSRRLNLPN
jgi:hypothetical protein